jgi:hypothetical protein
LLLEIYPASDPSDPIAPPVLDPLWLEPFPDELLPEVAVTNPEARYSRQENVTLAFMTALQLLPPANERSSFYAMYLIGVLARRRHYSKPPLQP